jgi:hypothetical protein
MAITNFLRLGTYKEKRFIYLTVLGRLRAWHCFFCALVKVLYRQHHNVRVCVKRSYGKTGYQRATQGSDLLFVATNRVP